MPRTAVTKKLADVLVMETLVVEGEAVRARVKRAHMMMLQRRFRAKQSCFVSFTSYVYIGWCWFWVLMEMWLGGDDEKGGPGEKGDVHPEGIIPR